MTSILLSTIAEYYPSPQTAQPLNNFHHNFGFAARVLACSHSLLSSSISPYLLSTKIVHDKILSTAQDSIWDFDVSMIPELFTSVPRFSVTDDRHVPQKRDLLNNVSKSNQREVYDPIRLAPLYVQFRRQNVNEQIASARTRNEADRSKLILLLLRFSATARAFSPGVAFDVGTSAFALSDFPVFDYRSILPGAPCLFGPFLRTTVASYLKTLVLGHMSDGTIEASFQQLFFIPKPSAETVATTTIHPLPLLEKVVLLSCHPCFVLAMCNPNIKEYDGDTKEFEKNNLVFSPAPSLRSLHYSIDDQFLMSVATFQTTAKIFFQSYENKIEEFYVNYTHKSDPYDIIGVMNLSAIIRVAAKYQARSLRSLTIGVDTGCEHIDPLGLRAFAKFEELERFEIFTYHGNLYMEELAWSSWCEDGDLEGREYGERDPDAELIKSDDDDECNDDSVSPLNILFPTTMTAFNFRMTDVDSRAIENIFSLKNNRFPRLLEFRFPSSGFGVKWNPDANTRMSLEEMNEKEKSLIRTVFITSGISRTLKTLELRFCFGDPCVSRCHDGWGDDRGSADFTHSNYSLFNEVILGGTNTLSVLENFRLIADVHFPCSNGSVASEIQTVKRCRYVSVEERLLGQHRLLNTTTDDRNNQSERNLLEDIHPLFPLSLKRFDMTVCTDGRILQQFFGSSTSPSSPNSVLEELHLTLNNSAKQMIPFFENVGKISNLPRLRNLNIFFEGNSQIWIDDYETKFDEELENKWKELNEEIQTDKKNYFYRNRLGLIPKIRIVSVIENIVKLVQTHNNDQEQNSSPLESFTIHGNVDVIIANEEEEEEIVRILSKIRKGLRFLMLGNDVERNDRILSKIKNYQS